MRMADKRSGTTRSLHVHSRGLETREDGPMGIQYPYAETMEGDVVFIGDTDPTPPRPSYKCLSCCRELRARYCRDKQDHFFHKVAGECVPET